MQSMYTFQIAQKPNTTYDVVVIILFKMASCILFVEMYVMLYTEMKL